MFSLVLNRTFVIPELSIPELAYLAESLLYSFEASLDRINILLPRPRNSRRFCPVTAVTLEATRRLQKYDEIINPSCAFFFIAPLPYLTRVTHSPFIDFLPSMRCCPAGPHILFCGHDCQGQCILPAADQLDLRETAQLFCADACLCFPTDQNVGKDSHDRPGKPLLQKSLEK